MARVGNRVVTAGELSRRIQSLPPFQLRMFGRTEEEIKRNFLEMVMVRDLLLSQGAVDQKLDEKEEVRDRVRATLRTAMLQSMRLEAASTPVTDADVEKFYNDNIDKFRAPERIAIWRILVATQEEAAKVIDEMKKDGSVKHWNELAREKSLDKATNMRGGNLGYVAADGKTTEPALTVEPAIYEAAKALKDDLKMSPTPVKEGDKWAVIWRRQSMKAVERSLELEAPGIRQTIVHQRTEAKLKELRDSARNDRVRDVNLEMVDDVAVTSQGDLQPARRPGLLPSKRPSVGMPQPGHDHR
ncbi:MAG: peptidyl-prolyl cis-trans isomerase [Polyangiaceae bacterium]|nr:peptidyl-prolyl cis-trans isomerase [Polyangiaceae bacterium]